MALNKSKGQMYNWVTHTWNTIKGACPHDCSYCYMKRWGPQRVVRFDEKELTDLGGGKFIFVGSSCDLFAKDIPNEWIERTLAHCRVMDNRYLFQTKNPRRLESFIDELPFDSVVCTTIESNRIWINQMGRSPDPKNRAFAMNEIAHQSIKTYVTIEPIMEFDIKEMIQLIEFCCPAQVNIGADSGNNGLPEPDANKITELIGALKLFTIVNIKKNLKRLL